MDDERSVYNQKMLEVIGLLEDIIVDEYLVTTLKDGGNMAKVYGIFLQSVKYSYRWFGIRSKNEFVSKWNDLRAELISDDPDFVDTSPSIQISILTQILQRLRLVTEEHIWQERSWLFDHIASIINVYDDAASGEEEEVPVMYDQQISSTVTQAEISEVLYHNHWLVVVILMSWVSNRCALQALGHLEYDNPT